MGITLAKQSSDLINILAKQYLKQFSGTYSNSEVTQKMEISITLKNQLKILEYHFPNDNHRLKLLAIVEWKEIEEKNAIIQILTKIQKNFRLFLHQKLTALSERDFWMMR